MGISRRRWVVALVIVALSSSVVLGVWLVVITEPPALRPERLTPWLLTQGATVAWDRQLTIDQMTQLSTIEITVLEVTDGNTTLRIDSGTTVVNETISAHEAEARLTTLAASLASLDPLRVESLSYTAQIIPFVGPDGTIAVLMEGATVVEFGGTEFTERRLTEMSALIPWQVSTTGRHIFGQRELVTYDNRTVSSLTGVELLLVANVDMIDLRVQDDLLTFHLFNLQSWGARLKGNSLVVDLESIRQSLVASIVDVSLLTPSTRFSLEELRLLSPLNGTHSLLRMQLPPGRHSASFQFIGDVSASLPVTAPWSSREGVPR